MPIPTNQEPFFITWDGRPRRELFPGVRFAVASGEKLMLSRVELDAGAVVPEHQHPHEQFGIVVEGDAEFTIGGETRHLVEGDYYAIPGGVLHKVITGPHGAVCLDIFSPPREEYRV
ncbi:MAG: cupin domain-containing protein [Chloroflexi bacterium]|nr:cupin domain-containing protein [Chloroflexota bacterium]